jgi:hypothetical protein
VRKVSKVLQAQLVQQVQPLRSLAQQVRLDQQVLLVLLVLQEQQVLLVQQVLQAQQALLVLASTFLAHTVH